MKKIKEWCLKIVLHLLIVKEINNIEIDNAKNVDIVMPTYSLIKCSDNYSKISASLWKYYRDQPNDNLTGSESFKSKIKITGKTPNDGNMKNVEIMKYLSTFWKTH